VVGYLTYGFDCGFNSAEYSGDLQSLSWLAMAFGGILGSVSGGLCLAVLKVKGIFLLFSIFPLLQLVSCIFIHEKSASQMAVANNEVLEGAQHITRDSPTADKQYNSSHGVSTNVTTTVWDGVGKAPVPIVVTRANDCSLL
jgi:hypothetical protein